MSDSTSSAIMCPTKIWASWMRAVSSELATIDMSHNGASMPPFLPVSAIVFNPFSFDVFTASMTFLALLLMGLMIISTDRWKLLKI